MKFKSKVYSRNGPAEYRTYRQPLIFWLVAKIYHYYHIKFLVGSEPNYKGFDYDKSTYGDLRCFELSFRGRKWE